MSRKTTQQFESHQPMYKVRGEIPDHLESTKPDPKQRLPRHILHRDMADLRNPREVSGLES